MPWTTVYRPLVTRLLGLVVAATRLGCSQPAPAPAFTDPAIDCNADLVSGKSSTLVTQQLVLPRATGGHTYSEDYDGDDKPENQLKNLLNLADIGGFDVRGVLERANQAGDNLLLLQLTSPDLGTRHASCASLTIRRALPPGPAGTPPKFDGTDMFQVADADTVTFYGRIDDLVFQSIRPRDQGPGVDFPLTILWPLSKSESVLMPLRGVGLTAQLQIDSQNRLVGMTEGTVHGVESAGALSALLVPAVARVLTTAINSAPSDDRRNMLIHWVEEPDGKATTRKCRVMADCCAHSPSTCKILPAEVMESAIGGVLAPDVEVFDRDGAWQPFPGGKSPNGYSVGFGFAAVPATF